MKILFVGVLDVSWSTNVEMKNALVEFGHNVDHFNYRTIEKENIPAWQQNFFFAFILSKLFSYLRRYDALPGHMNMLYYRIMGRKQMNQKLLKKVKSQNYDLVLFLKTDTVSPETVTKISESAKTWYYFMDPMEQAKRINAFSYARSSIFASATFSDVYEKFKQHNSKSFWMTQGIDTAVFKPKKVEKNIDIFFAGTKNSQRYRWIMALRENGLSVTCHGVGWEQPPVFREDLVDLYRRSKIVLNLCRKGAGFSVRVLQVLGTGTFLLSDYCHDLGTVFQKSKHLEWAETPEKLANKAKYYLTKTEDREAIAKEGCTFVHTEKNWGRLMDEIINISNKVNDDL